VKEIWLAGKGAVEGEPPLMKKMNSLYKDLLAVLTRRYGTAQKVPICKK